MIHRRRQRRHAFTLVELLISLGIALLLIYGINLIFRAVTDTIKTGNALASATRKLRSIDSALSIDFEGTYTEIDPLTKLPYAGPKPTIDFRFSGITPTLEYQALPGFAEADQGRQPAITIYNKRQIAFMSKTDQDADPDGLPETLDENEDGQITDFSDPAQAGRLGRRAHRIDTVSFFSNGTFAPKGMPASTAGASATAYQAWVWYGHCLQYGPAGDPAPTTYAGTLPVDVPTVGSGGQFYDPGRGTAATNTRNFYASDWALGRVAIGLVNRASGTTTFPGVVTMGFPSPRVLSPAFTEHAALPTAIGFTAAEHTVTNASLLSPGGTPDSMPVDTVVPPTARKPFTSGLNDVVGVWPGTVGGAVPVALLPTGAWGAATPTPATYNGLLRRYFNAQAVPETPAVGWWRPSVLANNETARPLRFNVVPAFAKPVQTSGVLTMNNKAALGVPYLAEGCSQFIVEFAGDFCSQSADGASTGVVPDGILDFIVPDPASPTLRSTRWYGMPRDLNGDGDASDALRDVVPVQLLSSPARTFEKTFVPGDNYIVAFGPNELYGTPAFRPALIRLNLSLVDSGGSLPDGLSREFVFKVR